MMVRCKAPLRIGLAGGGTDVSPYTDQYGGAILNATISLFAYAFLKLRDDHQVVLKAMDKQEEVNIEVSPLLRLDGNLDLAKGVFNRLVKDFNIPVKGFELTTYVDAPPGSGLGSSSTLVVAILGAFVEAFKLPLGEYDVAHLAYSIEREDLKMAGGRQDQYAATFGGFNFMEFYEQDRVIVNPLRIKNWVINELEVSLILYYTGISRYSSQVIEDQIQNVQEKNEQAIAATHQLKKEAILFKEALLKSDFMGIAEILRTSWEAKKKLSKLISNPQIDRIYQVARETGAYSGKISGAGGGGFIIFMVDPTKKIAVIKALKSEGGQVINFHFTKYGTQAWTL